MAGCWATTRRWPTSPGPQYDEAAAQGRHDRDARCRSTASSAAKIQVPADADQAAAGGRRAEPIREIAELLAGKTIVKAIVVPGRMVNFVVK